MKPDTYIAFDWPKFQADTQGLRREHKWSYWTAICVYYWAECRGLPDDDEFLCRACECESADWTRTKGAIFGRLFKRGDDGLWHQKRAKEEYDRAVRLMRIRRKAGKKGAESRWDDDGKPIANASQPYGKTMATGLTEPSVSHVPTPTPTDSKTPTKSNTRFDCIKAANRIAENDWWWDNCKVPKLTVNDVSGLATVIQPFARKGQQAIYNAWIEAVRRGHGAKTDPSLAVQGPLAYTIACFKEQLAECDV